MVASEYAFVQEHDIVEVVGGDVAILALSNEFAPLRSVLSS